VVNTTTRIWSHYGNIMELATSYLHQKINSPYQKTKDYYILTFQYFHSTAQFVNLKQRLDPKVMIVNISPDYPDPLEYITQYVEIAFESCEDIKFIHIRYFREEFEDVTVLEIHDSSTEKYYLRFTRNSNIFTFGKLFPTMTPIFCSDKVSKKRKYVNI
jgi:hypothetical protein